ncbi:GTP-binding protein, partial [filamentous cyanobacterium CCP5]
EYAVVRSLLAMGKRLLLVFNKADRYPTADLQIILNNLRQRLKDLAPADVLAIAASPQPVSLADGQQLRPDPDILSLLERLAEVLRQEGDTLIADTLLLQSEQLSQTAQNLIDQQRQRQAEAIVERYQWIGAGVIALSPPGIDLLATAAINAQMVVELSRIYQSPVSLEEGKRLAVSLAKTLTGLGIVKGSLELLAWGLQTNLATVVAGRALQGVSGAYLTHIAGKSFIEYFRRSQDWGDGGMVAVVQEQFQLKQRQTFIQAFVKQAIAESQPLQRLAAEIPNWTSDRSNPDPPLKRPDRP